MMEASLNQKSGGLVIPRQLSWRRKAAVAVAVPVARLIMKTWRCHWKDAELCPGVARAGDFLHLAQPAGAGHVGARRFCAREMALRRPVRHDQRQPGRRLSRQPAGTVRRGGDPGLDSRRGPQALLEATTWMEKNYSVAITPDGPRGPAYKVQEGIIHLAQLTGRPIIPVSNYTRRKIICRSWDKFQIPLPFARCELRWGRPFRVPRDATAEVREQLRLDLEKAMMAITTD